MSPLALYLFGLLIILGAVAFAAVLLNVPLIAVVVGVAVVLVLVGVWVTRRPRLRPSKFTGATVEPPTLDQSMLMELKTTMMERPDAARNARTAVIDQRDRVGGQPTTRLASQEGAKTEAMPRAGQPGPTTTRPGSSPPKGPGTSR